MSLPALQGQVPVVAPIKRDNESLFELVLIGLRLPVSRWGQFEIDNAEQLNGWALHLRIHQTGKGHQFVHRPSMSMRNTLLRPLLY